MKFDKGMKNFFSDIGKVLAHRIKPTTELNRLINSGDPKPLREFLKRNMGNAGFCGNGLNFWGSLSSGVEIKYNYPLNNLDDRVLTISWSQLATLMRDDVFREKYVFNNPKEDKTVARKMQFDTAITKDMQSAASDSFADNIKMIEINEIAPSENNFYEISDIELLANDIEREGLKHNLVVFRDSDTGLYKVKSGHRRLAAIKLLINEKRRNSTKVPCFVDTEKSNAESQFDLIMLNATQRKYSDADILHEYEEIERTLKELEAEGKPLKGRIRDNIAAVLKVSPAQVGKIENIKHNAIPEVENAVKNGKMSISTANEVAKLPEEKQQELVKDKPQISHKDVKELQKKENPKQKSPIPTKADFDEDEDCATYSTTDDDYEDDEDEETGEDFGKAEKENTEAPYPRKSELFQLTSSEAELLSDFLDEWAEETDDVFSILEKLKEFLGKV
ncbi:MAG: ParB/RepB/Spo0J family partition protein [Oscillospiraceae bacterium]